MNTTTTDFLTTNTVLRREIKAGLGNPDGKVFITTRLGLDLDNDEGVERFTASGDGELSMISEYEGAEWDMMLVRMASATKPIAVIERENVCEARGQIRNLINAGMTLTQAIKALLP